MKEEQINLEKCKQIQLFRLIKTCFTNKKYNQTIKLVNQYIKLFPIDEKINKKVKINDDYVELYYRDKQLHYKVLFMRARSYRCIGKNKKSLNELIRLVAVDPTNAYSLAELYFSLYSFYKYKEALQILPLVKKYTTIPSYTIDMTEYIIKKELGITFDFEPDGINYLTKTLYDNYDKKLVLDHISQHQYGNGNENDLFYSNVDLKYLYEIVTEQIKTTEKINKNDVLDNYEFAVPKIGESENGIHNFVRVFTLPNTNKIVTMYPCNYSNYSKVNFLEYDREKLFKPEEKQKIKTKSRIDKFNEKYDLV